MVCAFTIFVLQHAAVVTVAATAIGYDYIAAVVSENKKMLKM